MAAAVLGNAVRDDQDFQRHVDYIHYDPIKHGYVTRVGYWKFSSFNRFVQLAFVQVIGPSCHPDASEASSCLLNPGKENASEPHKDVE